MSDSLTAYEHALDPPQLAAYMEEQARRQWRLTKSATTPYDPAQAMEQFMRTRPQLYQHYSHLVTYEHPPVAPPVARSMPPPLLADEAREDLEALAKSYLSDGLVPTYEEGLAQAIRTRPDLYTAFTRRAARDTEPGSPSRPAAAGGPGRADGGRALATLEALAHDYIAKGLVDSYQAGLERAAREHPDLYEAHAQGIRMDSRSRRDAVSVQKVVR